MQISNTRKLVYWRAAGKTRLSCSNETSRELSLFDLRAERKKSSVPAMSLTDDESLLKLLGLSSCGSTAHAPVTFAANYSSAAMSSSMAPLDLPDLNALMAAAGVSSASSGVSGSGSGSASAPGSGAGSSSSGTGVGASALGSVGLGLDLGLGLGGLGLDPPLAVDGAQPNAAPAATLDSLLSLLAPPPPPSSQQVHLLSAQFLTHSSVSAIACFVTFTFSSTRALETRALYCVHSTSLHVHWGSFAPIQLFGNHFF